MDIKQTVFSAIKNPEQQAVERILKLPDRILQEELNALEKGITEAHNRATRTIRPVRLLLSIDAFLLLKGAGKLTDRGQQRPKYKDLICHPSVFSDTDINPYQYLILG